MPTHDQQDKVFAFLTELARRSAEKPVRIDTHAASVFLLGDRAYKIKRAVKFPFLDYSTLEKRRLACETEIKINRPFAPSIYISAIPITREPDGRLTLGGNGAAVEWAVQMHRFDETQTLDRVVPAGRFDDAAADRLGRTIASMHANAAPADATAWLAALERFIAQNADALKARPSLFDAAKVDLLDRSCRRRLEALLPLLQARAARGRVRRCHGDLHLANVVMLDNDPVPFDAIEFDDAVASGDVMYDLAFLLMDFVHCNANHAATIVLNRYLAPGAGDDDGLRALPLFMAVRAAIRAQVTAARLDRAAAPGDLAAQARAYFGLALRLIAPPPPTLIAIGGLSGTGKSVLARALASFVKPEPGAVLLRSDVERKRLAGVNETDPLPRDSYTREASQRLYAHLRDSAAAILRNGHSVIVDAVHAAPEERAAIAQIAADAGARFAGLFLTAGLQARESRIQHRSHDASDADVETARQQQAYRLGDIDWTLLDASGSSAQTLKGARSALSGLSN